MARDKSRPRYDDAIDSADDDVDGGYFTYRPLSNLPTPPLSSRNSSAHQSPRTDLEGDEPLDDKLRGPATHLVNLIPPSASLTTPSVPLVQAILARSSLPLDTIALAVCVLDALTSKFALSWRLQCPLRLAEHALPLPGANKRHTLPPSPLPDRPPPQWHIDAVRPEVIILAALVIAAKFTEEAGPRGGAAGVCAGWGAGAWSPAQLNATERCVMESLGYRIMPLCAEELIAGALADMRLAARQRRTRRAGNGDPQEQRQRAPAPARCHRKGRSAGDAIVGLGIQMTPAETPAE